MRWSKIKNIIILLLVIVNVSLLGMVGLQRWHSERAERETRRRLVTVMEQNEIAFLPAEVPGDLTLTGCRVTLTAPGAEEAEAFLGEAVPAQSVGARTTYEGARGQVTLSASGDVEGSFAPEAWPLSGKDPGAAGLELLSAIGIRAREVHRESEGEKTVVIYAQLWREAPVPGWTARLVYTPEALESLSLRRLAGTEELTSASEEPISASTALARFLEALNREGYVCSQVTDIYPGYAASGTGTVTLTPTWYVETDAKPWRFAVDGYSGTVTAEE